MKSELMISVIIPVYNGEKFIRRAVDSVLCQLDGRVELILVDDGSTDSSSAICDQYTSVNPNIHVVHKANGGLSSARNAGIEAASGQYVVFLDADDYLDKETCSSLINIIQKHQPDMIDYGWKYISSSGDISANRHAVPKGVLLDKSSIKDMILPPLLNLRKDDEHFIYDFACTKAFRSDILRQKNIRFDETRRIWEDRPFSVAYLYHCETFYSTEESFYNYVDMPNSLSRRYHLEFFDVILKNYKLYRELYDGTYDFDTQYVNNYWAQAIENMVFRSLEQKANEEIIRGNIFDTFQNKQVIHWFTKRKPNNKFQHKVGELIISGDLEKALEFFRLEMRKKNRGSWRLTVKRILRKALGKK